MPRKINTRHMAGSRWYVDEETGDQVPGVTSIIGMKAKPFLQNWAAKMAAELAVDSAPMLVQMAQQDRAGAIDYVKGAAKRYTAKRADVGSRAHDAAERLIRGLPVDVDADIQPYVDNFNQFLDVTQPELISAEYVAWSTVHSYAGSYDAILRMRLNDQGFPDPAGDPAVCMVDYKTGKSVYPDVAMQLAAYAHAAEIISPEGESHPMPEFDGGLVLHFTDTQWSLQPVDIGERVFDAFLALRKVFEFDRVTSRSVLGRKIAKGGGGFTTGTERRA